MALKAFKTPGISFTTLPQIIDAGSGTTSETDSGSQFRIYHLQFVERNTNELMITKYLKIVDVHVRILRHKSAEGKPGSIVEMLRKRKGGFLNQGLPCLYVWLYFAHLRLIYLLVPTHQIFCLLAPTTTRTSSDGRYRPPDDAGDP